MKEIHNILFLCGEYSSCKSANSVCVKNLAECFAQSINKIYVLAEDCSYGGTIENLNGIIVTKICGGRYEKVINYFAKRKWMYNWLFPIIQFLRYLIIIWIYPKTSLRDSNNIFLNAKRIIDDCKIDIIIATTAPYDTVIAAMRLKCLYGTGLKVVTYHMDLITNPNNKSFIISKIKKYKSKKMFEKEKALVDRILLPQSAPFIDNKKIVYVGFPLYIKNNDCLIEKDYFDYQKEINISIVGSLSSDNRNPYYICDVIDQLPKMNNKIIILHIWGSLTNVDLSKYTNVRYHGYAEIEEAPSILNRSDFLLNVGNAITYDMIPSKIFQIFSARKPIIFSISSEKDKSIPYFQKYGYSCFIKSYEKDMSGDIIAVSEFIENYYQKRIIVDDKVFENSTPRYICDIILAD